MTKSYYRILIATLVSGGISLTLMPSIRYWYWNYYYDMVAKENREALEKQQGEQGWNNDRSANGGLDFRQRPLPYYGDDSFELADGIEAQL